MADARPEPIPKASPSPSPGPTTRAEDESAPSKTNDVISTDPTTPNKTGLSQSDKRQDSSSSANNGQPIVAQKKKLHEDQHVDQDQDYIDNDIDDKHYLLNESRGQMSGRTLQERRSTARRRLNQTKAYAHLIEDRIVELEGKVRELRRDPPQHLEENSEAMFPLTHDVGESTWADFTLSTTLADERSKYGSWSHVMELDRLPKPVAEVLIEEPYHQSFGKMANIPRVLSGQTPMQIEAAPKSDAVVSEPYQIRLRSGLLLKTLQSVTGCNTTTGRFKHRLLLVRPFKLLVSYEKEIRGHADKLRKMHLDGNRDPLLNQSTSTPAQASGPIGETETKEALEPLEVLCSVMDKYLHRSLDVFNRLSFDDDAKVSFQNLWSLFKPGDEVLGHGASQTRQLYRVFSTTGGRLVLPEQQERSITNDLPIPASEKLKEEGYSEGSFIIECFYIHCDGNDVGPVNKTFHIRKFDGERLITSLPIVPLAAFSDRHDTRKNLIERGERFRHLADPRKTVHQTYKGLTADENQEQVESEVIIDLSLAFLQKNSNKPRLGLEGLLVSNDVRECHPLLINRSCTSYGCCGNDVPFDDYKEVDSKLRDRFWGSPKNKSLLDIAPYQMFHFSREHLALLPPYVNGFVLRTRRWAVLDIRLLEDPNYGNGWDNLVLGGNIKETILAQVESHSQRSSISQAKSNGSLAAVDLVQGKGHGLIILLHGEPGVGKTSTAECVAAHTKRPLFPITCGDIGDKAEMVEANLERNFQLAHKWSCVLLLDEADIFLSARNQEDIQRNAIVSVFLRSLEYYSGILFLTTNRVGLIDRAFKSRIHLSLLYKKLDLERTIKIWRNNLDRAAEDGGKGVGGSQRLICQNDEILAFAKKHFRKMKKSRNLVVWNGRQIRNAFQTAIALANHEAKSKAPESQGSPPILSAAHFEKVASVSSEFERYLKSTTTKNDSQYAREFFERDDEPDSSDQEPSSSSSDSGRKRRKKKKRKAAKRKRKLQAGMWSNPNGEEGGTSETTDTDEKVSSSSRKRRRV